MSTNAVAARRAWGARRRSRPRRSRSRTAAGAARWVCSGSARRPTARARRAAGCRRPYPRRRRWAGCCAERDTAEWDCRRDVHGRGAGHGVARHGQSTDGDGDTHGHGRGHDHLVVPAVGLCRPDQLQQSADGDGRVGHLHVVAGERQLAPGWLTLAPGGLLSGTAPAGVVYPANAPLTFSVTATDGATLATKQFQIVVYPNVTITSTSPLPTAYFTVPYSYQFTATGGPTSSYTFAVGTGGGLPGWLTLTPSGLLRGRRPPARPHRRSLSWYRAVALWPTCHSRSR